LTRPSPAAERSGERLRHVFRALRHADFRLFWVGQWISVTGTWMQTMALSWLVYKLTDSPAALGFLTAVRFGPSLFGSPFAGVLADRVSKRSLVLATQTASLLQASALAFLTLSGHVKLWHVLALALIQGISDMVDMPARQTLQVDLVGVEDLQSAVSLNSTAFNAGRMLGPALAGVVVAEWGEGLCFALNAASYLAVLIALLTIRPRLEPRRLHRSVLTEIGEGFQYAWNEPAVRSILIGVAVTSAVGLSYSTLLPVLARDVLHAGARGYGFLLAGAGCGAIAGALLAAARRGGRALAVNQLGQAALGVGLMALGVAPTLPVAVAVMGLVGLAVAVQLSTTNGFLQTTAPPALRGRVVSLYTWLFAGLAPLGALPVGLLAERIGAPRTAIGAGVLCVVSALLLAAESRRRATSLQALT
jgi:MFS family permease